MVRVVKLIPFEVLGSPLIKLKVMPITEGFVIEILP